MSKKTKLQMKKMRFNSSLYQSLIINKLGQVVITLQ